MKIILIYLFSILIIILVNNDVHSQSRWVKINIEGTLHVDDIYYDSKSIVYSDNYVYVWCLFTLNDFSSDNEVNGTADKYRINCIKRSILSLSYAIYKNGYVNESWNTSGAEEFYSKPGDYHERIIDAVCK